MSLKTLLAFIVMCVIIYFTYSYYQTDTAVKAKEQHSLQVSDPDLVTQKNNLRKNIKSKSSHDALTDAKSRQVAIENKSKPKLQFHLHGTIAGKGKTLDQAIISLNGGTQHIYNIGESLLEGVTLKSITPQEVTIDNMGLLEKYQVESQKPANRKTSSAQANDSPLKDMHGNLYDLTPPPFVPPKQINTEQSPPSYPPPDDGISPTKQGAR